jgi:hypothetical protein
MGKLSLQLKCTLENLKDLYLPLDAEWNFKTKCSNCQEESEKVQSFIPAQVQDMPGSRGEANYVAKCKLCERTGSILYCVNTHKKYNSNEEWQDVATFECRGLDIFEFFPGDHFVAVGEESEMVFGVDHGEEPIELMDGDWAGFDEDGDCAVGIYEFKS